MITGHQMTIFRVEVDVPLTAPMELKVTLNGEERPSLATSVAHQGIPEGKEPGGTGINPGTKLG
jgi:hypothetical protein